MSKTITILLGQAIAIHHDGKMMTLGLGYHVVPRSVWDPFAKEHDDFVQDLIDEGKLQLDVKVGTTPGEREAKRTETQKEKAHFGPMTLVSVVKPGGYDSKGYRLEQADGTVLPATYESHSEATRLMLEHNTKAWEGYEAKQPKAKAS